MPRHKLAGSKRLQAVRDWSGVVFGLAGTLLAVAGFVRAGNASQQSRANEHAINQIELSRLLNEAWDLMGGRPGTTLLYEFNTDPGALELANRKINDALVLDSKNAMAHRLRGVSAESFGNLSDALAAYDVALRLEPQSAVTLISRGIALTGLNRPAEALDSFRRAVAFETHKVVALINSAAVLWNSGHQAEARELFIQAREVLDSPQRGVLHFDADRLRSLLDRQEYEYLSNPGDSVFKVELVRGTKRSQEVIR